MTSFRAFLFALAISSSSVYAQFDQTYVSAEKGNDKQSCEFIHPCQTITRAISQTNPRGDVIILDSGPYDDFVVSKAITITAAPGVQPTIAVAHTTGALITAGARDFITLRGLAFNAELRQFGIRFLSGKALLVESCLIHGSTVTGISIEGPGYISIKDTNIRNGASLNDGFGIVISPQTGTALVTIEHCRVENNDGVGIDAVAKTPLANSKVTVRDTVSSGNMSGFNASAWDGTVEMNLENCATTNNGGGVGAFAQGSGNATVRVSGSVITNNLSGIATFGAGAAVLSRGNNTVEGNTTNNSFTGLYVAK